MSDLRVLGKEHEQESSWNNFFFKAVLNIILLASKKRGRNKDLYSYRNVGNSHCLGQPTELTAALRCIPTAPLGTGISAAVAFAQGKGWSKFLKALLIPVTNCSCFLSPDLLHSVPSSGTVANSLTTSNFDLGACGCSVILKQDSGAASLH